MFGKVGPVRRITAVVVLALATSLVAVVPVSAAEAPGQGTAEVQVTTARFVFAEPLEVRVVDTASTVTFDPTSEEPDARKARGEVTGLVLEGGDGARLAFPDPPLTSETEGGREEASEGETGVVVPPHRLRADADEIAATTARTLNDVVFRHRDTGAEEEVDEGTVARGTANPARVVSVVDPDEASVTASSEIADLMLLEGVSTLEGVGPGDHRSWAGTGEAGASARALKIASATLLETGAALDLLGVSPDAIPNAVLADMAHALGVIPSLAEPVSELGFPVPGDAAELAALLDTVGSELRGVIVDTVFTTPLLAIADTSGSVTSVASVSPNGEVHTSAASRGSVGTISVGTTELSGFDAAGTADDWNRLEARLRELLNSVTGTLGSAYEDVVTVRVLPRIAERTALEGEMAVAESQISLLEVVVDPPSSAPAAPTQNTPDEESTPEPSGLLQVEGELSNGGAGGPIGGALLGSPDEDATRIVVGDMASTATHARPGVDPYCEPVCTDGGSANRPWNPERGFTGSDDDLDLTSGALPHTGPHTGFAFAAVALISTAAALRGLTTAARCGRPGPLNVPRS